MSPPKVSEDVQKIAGSVFPATSEDQNAVREQLARLLVSPLFATSKRNPSFLRYVVEKTLEGQTECLKERTLGVEIFSRQPDYNTAEDHVVRSTAGEVRKRLAQYYMEAGRDCEVRIELPAGSYVPQFRLPTVPVQTVPSPPAAEPAVPRGAQLPIWYAVATLILASIAFAVGAFLWRPAPIPDASLRHFWDPLVARHNAVLLCIGEDQSAESASHSGRAPTIGDLRSMTHRTINIEDAIGLTKIAGVLNTATGRVRILTQSATTLEDLQQGPAILIGAFNNDWTMNLIGGLRFQLERSETRFGVIRDVQNPSQFWSPRLSDPSGHVETDFVVTRDYAIVARRLDPQINQLTVIVAGITGYGTTAASEFLTNAQQIRKLEARAPAGWQKKNLELVLATEVVKGIASPPEIVATYFW